MRISDWSSDVCSSDLIGVDRDQARALASRTAKNGACGHDPADGAKLRHHGRQMPFKIRVGADTEEAPRHGFSPRPVSATRRSNTPPPSIAPTPGSEGPHSEPGRRTADPAPTGVHHPHA